MSIFEVHAPWHNPRSPKCRACKFWGTDPENADLFSEECQDETAPIRNRTRDHNDRACSHFRRWKPEVPSEEKADALDALLGVEHPTEDHP